MPNYVPPSDKADGQILFGADWNGLKNALASYLNNGGIGNAQVSSNPAERIDGSKINPDSGAHHARHEPGGADEVNDIDISNTGTPLSAHASRHAAGGADPLPAGSISAAMLQAALLGDAALVYRKDSEIQIASNLGITYNPRTGKAYVLSQTNAHPRAQGVVRSGKVYFSCYGIDAVLELTPSTGAQVYINLVSGDKPKGLVLVGTDIYVLCAGTGAGNQRIKKINSNNNVSTIGDLRTQGAAATADLIDLEGMVLNSARTHVYTLGARTGDTVNRVLMRVSLTLDAGVTHKVDLGVTNTPEFFGLTVAKNADTERVCVLYKDTVPTSLIKTYAEGDLSVIGSVTYGNTLARGANIVFDGQWVRAFDRSSPLQGWEVLTQTNPFRTFGSGNLADTNRIVGFFDGRFIHVNDPGATRPTVTIHQVMPNGVSSPYLIDDPGATCVANGFASDGSNLWVAASNAATDQARIIKVLV